MNVNIFKFQLTPEALQEVEMPKGSKILHAGMQREKICLWAQCPHTEEKEKRTVAILPTGSTPTPDTLTPRVNEQTYIGTVHLEDSRLIFHLFDITQ